MVAVLFVCLGNICRSPMAEAVFAQLSARSALALSLDSAGTCAAHLRAPPDPRTVSVLQHHDVVVRPHTAARQVEPHDFADFDYVIAMDRANLDDLLFTQRGLPGKAVVRLFSSFGDCAQKDVPDPYYGGRDGFEEAFQLVTRFSRELLAFLEKTHLEVSAE